MKTNRKAALVFYARSKRLQTLAHSQSHFALSQAAATAALKSESKTSPATTNNKNSKMMFTYSTRTSRILATLQSHGANLANIW